MPSASSKKPAGKPVRRRKFSDKEKFHAVHLAHLEGVTQAAAKLRVHPSAIYSWRLKFQRRANAAGHTTVGQGKTAVILDKVPPETYVLARKLQAALKVLRASGGDLSDVEIYATLLIRKILGS